MCKPTMQHLDAAKRVICYVYTTRYYAIEYSADRVDADLDGDTEDLHDWLLQEFLCASDAAYADDEDTRKST